MSSFIEFQALVLDKLCTIENRLSAVEKALGVNEKTENTADLKADAAEPAERKSLINDISEFHSELADIKSLFSASEF